MLTVAGVVAPLALNDIGIAVQGHIAAIGADCAVIVGALIADFIALRVPPGGAVGIGGGFEVLMRTGRYLRVGGDIVIR